MPDTQHIRLVAFTRPGLTVKLPQLMSLSQGSLIVRSHDLLESGQAVQVTIHFIDSGREILIDGEVVWANQKLGDMALRFVSITASGREAIAEFLVEQAWYR